ncbi:hypothetical protein [Aurantiacibacter sp. D1-12]|uniref:hypothetical protein n=1 Tax=Aurantiacibacter sp. D1-12 TaxID=2993658 RepID=UPI00237D1F56|nr:hypothetical protein [Aurantiacibacter sp. D1-12]MDE1467841.1 hypothetical protein [Aurantiacibacter sp. D1-12]
MERNSFIAALRSDRSPQRQAQGAIAQAHLAWLAESGVRDLMADLKRYGAGAPLENCFVLETLFTGTGEAERVLDLLQAHYCSAIRANPIAHPPFRNGFDGRASSLQLARVGRAQLMLQAREPGEFTSESYGFSDGTRFEAVVAGKAEARIIRAHRFGDSAMQFETQRVSMNGGERLTLDLSSEALVIDKVEQRLVILRLIRTAAEPEPTREYCAQSRELLHQSAGLISTSRQEAIIALLGRMGRTDAAPEMARIALAESDLSLRWQALRECLALDSEVGFCTLARIARDGQDPLSAAAGALRAQLLEQYPEFAQVEAQQCPA